MTQASFNMLRLSNVLILLRVHGCNEVLQEALFFFALREDFARMSFKDGFAHENVPRREALSFSSCANFTSENL